MQNFYQKVPLGALAWAIIRTGPNTSNQPASGWSFDFLENTVTVASLRYKGDLLVQADVIAGTEKEAKQVVDSAGVVRLHVSHRGVHRDQRRRSRCESSDR